MTLWLLMAAITCAAALWLTRPLWQRHSQSGVARTAANVAAYSSRLNELDADIAAGVLPADEAAAIQQEMDSRLLADASASAQTAAPRRSEGQRFGVLALLLALTLPVFAGFWYWQAGSWRTAQQIATAPVDGGAPSDADIEAMVARLAAKLQAQPDDAQGWSMLGRSYFVMSRFEDAAKAYSKANELSKSANADWLVSEGEALALSRDRDLLGRPAQLFEAALALDATYGKAIWYGSLADAQGGNFERAGQRLQQLLAQDLPEDLKTMVVARLDELRSLSGAVPSSAPTAPPTAAASEGTQLTVQITLAPVLAKQLPANATLFVFAKAAKGPPMPLAVQKLPGAKLPLTITLDDTMAMTPAMTLSQFDRYVVTARLSVAGTALAASGDLEGSVELARSEAGKPLMLTINRVVP
ncbi:MAG: c-type cytochrome biogenesis protein CcmI [Stagnimonas sp.]|nr:c-type cytochrome biogenesis protein CcmI [Stagnimonas sp.]